MYKNNMKKKAPVLTPDTVHPAIAYANYKEVDPGSFWGPRTISDFELILIIAGKFEYEIHGKEKYNINEGSVLCIYPEAPHTLRALTADKQSFFSCIHCELMPNACWRNGDYRLDPEPDVITENVMDQSLDMLFKACDDAMQGYNKYREELMSNIVKAIWIKISEAWKKGRSFLPSPRMQAMQAYIRTNLEKNITRNDLAKEFSITPEHVNFMFRKELEITPGYFIAREKILAASRLIKEEGLSAKEASVKFGFYDPFHFSRVFKKIMHYPPSRLR